ncbi:MAG TPA: hypothetical protein P5234_12795 [Thermoanaerobaculaceae bacterium]|nr:hypothetical protein [Thermoanaerobaculaceae bacterium]HRS17110.1 hypothetical protein [Thermoanaerobaculaceae bacterium]
MQDEPPSGNEEGQEELNEFELHRVLWEGDSDEISREIRQPLVAEGAYPTANTLEEIGSVQRVQEAALALLGVKNKPPEGENPIPPAVCILSIMQQLVFKASVAPNIHTNCQAPRANGGVHARFGA